ncbi:A/G-specific adenine glycosylase [Allopusillimonas soli]|uniref:Adenine DNA glycosylase n=1 Tax=Allopusillimonas soli TaxID=659016 RepID=A0A853F8T0_9BURK|nr:A/G-specific adenine glycosylase [Allopusillimonas soli]NYT36208.1 A/G-specific adenine glycosylase [Allopusillimonas soli]TEA76795.1 A/G-specific adenine glycosylase [Allopusillimonas soli]
MASAAPAPHITKEFAAKIARWQIRHGRRGLPWQDTRDPYRIWLSEIMLQQTQVSTVVGYYERFLKRFPDIQTLASATQEEVMPYWAGLGYYARARNLHRCAQVVCNEWDGRFPVQAADIATLPGIGASTAAAIAAFSQGERSPIMDGNVRRVFARFFGVHGQPGLRRTENALWGLARAMVDNAPADLDMTAYTQGLMDLGAMVCTRSRPRCDACPLTQDCHARQHGCQQSLPTPRAKKPIPQRNCAMLVAVCDDQILLEEQPSPGIWGGLWSLPRFDQAQDLQAACGAAGSPQRMAGLTHVFTHFRLDIDPWLLQASHVPPALRETDARAWVPIASLADTALPAPVRKILTGLFPAQSGA